MMQSQRNVKPIHFCCNGLYLSCLTRQSSLMQHYLPTQGGPCSWKIDVKETRRSSQYIIQKSCALIMTRTEDSGNKIQMRCRYSSYSSKNPVDGTPVNNQNVVLIGLCVVTGTWVCSTQSAPRWEILQSLKAWHAFRSVRKIAKNDY
jgi:hypothetical protein